MSIMDKNWSVFFVAAFSFEMDEMELLCKLWCLDVSCRGVGLKTVFAQFFCEWTLRVMK